MATVSDNSSCEITRLNPEMSVGYRQVGTKAINQLIRPIDLRLVNEFCDQIVYRHQPSLDCANVGRAEPPCQMSR